MFSTKISLHNLSLLEFKIDDKLNSISFIRISLVYSEKKDSLKTNFESLEFLHSCTSSLHSRDKFQAQALQSSHYMFSTSLSKVDHSVNCMLQVHSSVDFVRVYYTTLRID